jgi:hypothetical protein
MHLKMWSMQALSGPVLAAVGERYYKVTAEALRVCGELVKAIRPNFDMVRYYFFDVGTCHASLHGWSFVQLFQSNGYTSKIADNSMF